MTIERVKNILDVLVGMFVAIAAYFAEAVIYVYENYIIDLKEPALNACIAMGKCVVNILKMLFLVVEVTIIALTCVLKLIFEFSFLYFYNLNNFLKKINKKLKKYFIILKNYLKKSIEFRKEIINMDVDDDPIPTISNYAMMVYEKGVVQWEESHGKYTKEITNFQK